MGVAYEFNWYLVAENEQSITKLEDNTLVLHKNGKRVYPVGLVIPLIIKNIGCIGEADIKKIEVDSKSTNIYFSITANYDVTDVIAEYHYKKYLDFKKSNI